MFGTREIIQDPCSCLWVGVAHNTASPNPEEEERWIRLEYLLTVSVSGVIV
jgi:hypothetical protein